MLPVNTVSNEQPLQKNDQFLLSVIFRFNHYCNISRCKESEAKQLQNSSWA